MGGLADRVALLAEVKALLTSGLRLDVQPDDIGDDSPIFGEGLGLDSIDALELVLELQRTFHVVVSDEHMGQRVLRSVRTIVQFIEEQTETKASIISTGPRREETIVRRTTS